MNHTPVSNTNGSGDPDDPLALPTRPAAEFVDWHPGRDSEGGRSSGIRGDRPNNGLSTAELAYLGAVVDHPGQPSSAYPKLAGIGSRKALAVRKELMAKGYLREHQINTSARGRTSILLEPLKPAFQALGRGLGENGREV